MNHINTGLPIPEQKPTHSLFRIWGTVAVTFLVGLTLVAIAGKVYREM